MKTPSNKTPALTKSVNMNIWVVGTSNRLFIRGSFTETKNFQKNKVVSGKTPFFMIGYDMISSFCTSHSIWLDTGFVRATKK